MNDWRQLLRLVMIGKSETFPLLVFTANPPVITPIDENNMWHEALGQLKEQAK